MKKNEFNYYYGYNDSEYFNEIALDSFSNYYEVLLTLEENACKGKHTILKFQNERTVYKIVPMNFCSKEGMIFDYFLREVICVTNDSVIVNEKLRYPDDSLKHILERHLINKENDPNYPILNDKGFLQMKLDSFSSIQETNKILQNIANDFNEINHNYNDTLKLFVEFELNKYRFPQVIEIVED